MADNRSGVDKFFDGMDSFLDSAERVLPADQPDDGEDEENEPIVQRSSSRDVEGVSGLVVSRHRYLLVGARAPWHIVRASDNLVLLSGMDREVVSEVCQLMNRYGKAK